jgi:hypothetical protein
MVRIRRKLTEEEKKESPHSKRQWTQFNEPSGKLVMKISMGPEKWQDFREFADSDTEMLESQMNKAMCGVIELLWKAQLKRLEERQKERRRLEEYEKREKEAQRLKAEQERRATLEASAINWHKANTIRQYITASEIAWNNNALKAEHDMFAQWKEWASRHADELDPLTSQTVLVNMLD